MKPTGTQKLFAIAALLGAVVISLVLARPDIMRTEAGGAARKPLTELADGVFFISPETYLDTVRHLTKQGVVFVPAPQQDAPASEGSHAASEYLGPESCRECHAAYVDSASATAHYRTCQIANAKSLPDAFAEGKNNLPTASPQMFFEMSQSGESFYQSVVVQRRGQHFEHKERIDIVTGSAKYGQTFLYWKNQCLYELPVSHFTDLNEWINSPGYLDGVANFARPISARCLECHTTWIEQKGSPFNRFLEKPSVLGITCEKCHGPGREHVEHHRGQPDDKVARHIVNPGNLPREYSMDVCSLCHSGAGEPLQDSFTFRPGDRVADFVMISPETESGPGGVHSANQQARMALSKCYQQSNEMQCTTCHNPHRQERGDVKLFVERCLKCHETQDCSVVVKQGAAAEDRCIDCHMPRRSDSQMPMQKQNEVFRPMLRDHLIGKWEDVTADVLEEIAADGTSLQKER